MSSGFQFSYAIQEFVPDASFYWLVLESSSGRITARDVMSHGKCSGNGPQEDEREHMVTVRCTLTPGEAYNLWFAVDFNGNGQGIFLSPKQPPTIQIPFGSKLPEIILKFSLLYFIFLFKACRRFF